MQEPLLKIVDALILPASLAPLHKVRQVEIEAGDSEGRLPFVVYGLGPWVFGLWSTRLYSHSGAN
jgi:hypothetical protein